jgi:hypothetical protein
MKRPSRCRAAFSRLNPFFLCAEVPAMAARGGYGFSDDTSFYVMRPGSLPIARRVDQRITLVTFEGSGMHDFLAGVVFIAIVMAPCVVALTVKLGDGGSE